MFGELSIESPLGQAVVDELRNGQLMKMYQEQKQMAEVQKARGQRIRTSELNPTMMIPPTSYHYWGQRLGYECWEDAQFVREYWRDNEVCRVNTRPANVMIGWTAALNYGKRQQQKSNLAGGIYLK